MLLLKGLTVLILMMVVVMVARERTIRRPT
jgi:hypothetical protein